MNKKQRDEQRNRIERFDREFKDKFVVAFMLAPVLSVMILSVMYQSFSSTKIALASEPGVVLGWLSLITVAGALALAVMYNKTFVTLAISMLFGLASVSYGIVMICGTTDVLDDGFFDMLLSTFILPIISFISVTGIGNGTTHIAPLIIALVITAVSVAATVYIIKKQKKLEAERAKKAEARKSDNRRRKVR